MEPLINIRDFMAQNINPAASIGQGYNLGEMINPQSLTNQQKRADINAANAQAAANASTISKNQAAAQKAQLKINLAEVLANPLSTPAARQQAQAQLDALDPTGAYNRIKANVEADKGKQTMLQTSVSKMYNSPTPADMLTTMKTELGQWEAAGAVDEAANLQKVIARFDQDGDGNLDDPAQFNNLKQLLYSRLSEEEKKTISTNETSIRNRDAENTTQKGIAQLEADVRREGFRSQEGIASADRATTESEGRLDRASREKTTQMAQDAATGRTQITTEAKKEIATGSNETKTAIAKMRDETDRTRMAQQAEQFTETLKVRMDELGVKNTAVMANIEQKQNELKALTEYRDNTLGVQRQQLALQLSEFNYKKETLDPFTQRVEMEKLRKEQQRIDNETANVNSQIDDRKNQYLLSVDKLQKEVEDRNIKNNLAQQNLNLDKARQEFELGTLEPAKLALMTRTVANAENKTQQEAEQWVADNMLKKEGMELTKVKTFAEMEQARQNYQLKKDQLVETIRSNMAGEADADQRIALEEKVLASKTEQEFNKAQEDLRQFNLTYEQKNREIGISQQNADTARTSAESASQKRLDDTAAGKERLRLAEAKLLDAQAQQKLTLPSGLVTLTKELETNAQTAYKQNTAVKNVLKDLEKIGYQPGIFGKITEATKRALGTQDARSYLQKRMEGIQVDEVMARLAGFKGSTTDRELNFVSKPIPDANANPELALMWLEDLARISRKEQLYNQYASKYVKDNKSAAGMTEKWSQPVRIKGGLIEGPYGEPMAYADFVMLADEKNVTPEQLIADLENR